MNFEYVYNNVLEVKFEIIILLISISLSFLLSWLIDKLFLSVNRQKIYGYFNERKIEILLPASLIFCFINQIILYSGMLTLKFLDISSYKWLTFGSKINLILLLLSVYQALIKPSFFSKIIKILIIIPITYYLFSLHKIDHLQLDAYGIKIGDFNLSLLFVIKAIYLLTFLIIVGRVILKLTRDFIQAHQEWNINTRETLMKVSSFVLYITLFLIGINILGINITALTVFSGAFGVGVGLSLQKISSNFFSGIVLLVEKNIAVGNVIQSASGLKGRVKYLGARSIVIDEFNGSEAIIPNDDLINSKVMNWKVDEKIVMLTVDIMVAIENDPQVIISLLLEAAKNYPALKSFPMPIAYMAAYNEDKTICYSLEFWVQTKNVDLIKSETLQSIWKLFRKHQIRYV